MSTTPATRPNGVGNGVGNGAANGGARASSNGHTVDEKISSHPFGGRSLSDTPSLRAAYPPQDPNGKIGLNGNYANTKQQVAFGADEHTKSARLWGELGTMRWMRVPASSAKILCVPIILWILWHFLSPERPNPFSHVLWISGRLPDSSPDNVLYRKTYWDALFVAYYVVVFSFIRQSITLYMLRPLARYLGIRKEGKLDRFAEQGYAILYWGVFSVVGLNVMRGLPTWWYRTENFWLGYPHWRITPTMKSYYLLQAAYWIQQLMVLVLRIEKPRKDFRELAIHHVVTLWLIIMSYTMNMTYIGNAVFITMDFSDVFFALSKTLNYLKLDRTSIVSFAWFILVWTYMRHYQNIRILWSVWSEFHLAGAENMVWDTANGLWMPPWIRYQIFGALFVLQLVNLFWYFLIWRVLYRIIFNSVIADERSDDEGDDDPVIDEQFCKED